MRAVNKLTPTQVRALEKPGRYADGLGLYLQISSFGTKAWIFRYQLDGKARQMGLGSVHEVTLPKARQAAINARELLREGIDPIEDRKARREANRLARIQSVTFRDCAAKYIAAHEASWKNEKHRAQWQATLETYAFPIMGDLGVSQIGTAEVLRVLEPIWTQKIETANRLRGRIEAVLDWAKARELRDGENPARWRGHLDKTLPKPSRVRKPKHHPAMPIDALPGFMTKLRAMDTMSARALEFTILTATRTGEVIGATWSEVDLDAKVWTIPGERMKAGQDHEIPLCARAVKILTALKGDRGASDFVFPGANRGNALSNMAMLQLLKGIDGCDEFTVHGFRSTFRDWAGDHTSFDRDVIEMALAHTIQNKAEKAYRRATALEKRRRLMDAWAAFCAAPKAPQRGDSKVVAIGGRA